jgi:hypothetical protein
MVASRHDAKYGAAREGSPLENSPATIKLAHYPSFWKGPLLSRRLPPTGGVSSHQLLEPLPLRALAGLVGIDLGGAFRK